MERFPNSLGGEVEGKVEGKVPTYQIFFGPHWQSQRRFRGSQFLLHTSSMEKKFWPAVPRVRGWFFDTDMIRICTISVVDLN